MSKPVDKSRWVGNFFTKITSGHVTTSQAPPPPSSPIASMPPPAFPNFPDFDDYLLQPADDGKFRRDWVLLDGLIDSHVNEFYQSDQVISSVKCITEDLDHYEVVGPERVQDLSDLLYWPQYRHLGLRICVARILLSSIDFHGHWDETSLPVQVVELLRKFQEVHPTANAVDDVALAKWRMLTAFLLSPPQRTSNKETLKEKHFPCVETLDEVLGRFTKRVENQSELDSNRMRSLHKLATHTATFGEMLLAHPSTWIFQWTTQSTPHPSRNTSEDTQNGAPASQEEETDAIVLFPALLRCDAPAKAGKQKGRAIIVQPANVGSGFVSKEITILEKKNNEPIPSIDSGFSIVEPREFEILRSNTGREGLHASRPPTSRHPSAQAQSQPHYASVVETEYRGKTERVQVDSPRSHYSNLEYVSQSPEQSFYAAYSPEEGEQSGRRRTRRKKNRSQGGRN